MSLKSAIESAKAKVVAAYAAISAKGGALPTTQNLANLPQAIAEMEVKPQKLMITSFTFGRGTKGEKLVVADYFDCQLITSLQSAFAYSGYKIIDLRGCNFGRITNMFQMIGDPATSENHIEKVYLRGVDTQYVTNVGYFANTQVWLEVLDVANCNFSSAQTLNFYRCGRLYTLIDTNTIEDVRSGEILVFIGYKNNLDMHWSPLNFASMLAICKGVGNPSSTMTITLNETKYNALTESEQSELDAALDGKNYVLATA